MQPTRLVAKNIFYGYYIYILYIAILFHICCHNHLYVYIQEPNSISLSTIVLNSRDWSEIVWLPEISRFKINLAISFIRKKPAGMHWLGLGTSLLCQHNFEHNGS